jgi:hypothetical protein
MIHSPTALWRVPETHCCGSGWCFSVFHPNGEGPLNGFILPMEGSLFMLTSSVLHTPACIMYM